MPQPPAARSTTDALERPLVVLYLYVHDLGERFAYPNARTGNSVRTLAVRYLECALTQAATLRLQDADCDIALATNGIDKLPLGRRARQLLAALRALGVELLDAPYRHRPPAEDIAYASSRYVFDAIIAAAAGQSPDRPLWLTDLDCVWVRPAELLTAVPAPPAVGCLFIDYPADWNTVGSPRYGSRREIAELAGGHGGAPRLPFWVGGELLGGSAATLLELVARAEQADAELARREIELATEEQLLTLLEAQGRARFEDLSRLGRRIQTGRRHDAEPVADAQALAFWHLPAEKGLSMRRTASDLIRGREAGVRADLATPGGAAARFRVAPSSPARQLRDGAWIAAHRARALLRAPQRRPDQPDADRNRGL